MQNDTIHSQTNSTLTLDEQRIAFTRRRLLATPLAGVIIWFIIGVLAFFMPEKQMVLVLYIGTGSIVYLALILSKFTGENLTKKNRPKNEFDRLFFLSAGAAILVYSIAIPFSLNDYTSLPLSIGILTGLMWLPVSWIIRHWVGYFHTISRTALVLLAWYAFPQNRFLIIPFVIVGIYIVSIIALERRWRTLKQ